MKLLVVLLGLILMFLTGYYAYTFLNRKITENEGIVAILLYAIALFAALGAVYFGGLYAMAKVYTLLMSNE